MTDPTGNSRRRVLVTNDDGVDAPALAVLAGALAACGHDVQVAAPLVEHTGCGASLGAIQEGGRVEVRSVSLTNCPGLPAVAVDAPPALIVLAACQGRFGRVPDVVVSGPNAGYNTGSAVLHSGTVNAALTAAAHGVPGIAFSTERHAVAGFGTAAEVCAALLAELVELADAACAVSVNVPDLALAELAGVRATSLATNSLVSIGVGEVDGGLQLARLHNDRPELVGVIDTGVDTDAIRAGFVSVTRIHGGMRDLPSDAAALQRALSSAAPAASPSGRI